MSGQKSEASVDTASFCGNRNATAPVIQLQSVSKQYGSVRVLKDVSLEVLPGEVHALMGENGAGKSTIIKIMSGFHKANSGKILINGGPVQFESPRDAELNGIAVVYQELLLFPELTVAENIYLGHAPRTSWRTLDWNAMRTGARELLDSLDCHDLRVDQKVGELSVANRQRVEIAKALAQKPQLLIMDEPTAALTDVDVDRLLDVVRRLRSRGVATLYVSHRMPEIFALADRVSVLRDGACVATMDIADADQKKLVALMVGRPVEQMFPKLSVPIGKTVLKVNQLSHGEVVKDVSFELRAGEILGVAGLIGSGRTELAHTIFGVTPATGGSIEVDGNPVTIKTPKAARDLGIAYVPEDRGLQGIVRSMTISENVSMAVLDRISAWSFIPLPVERKLAKDDIDRLSIRTHGPDQLVGELSGGNQQKVVLAKWLATSPRVLIMDEPTRGIDVGAKAEIHALMGRLAQEGLAILMISSELPEVLGLADRVLVMKDGRLVEEISRSEATSETVGFAMTHARAVQEEMQ
jgi:ABC-type sugar transport system ATPase subunit